MLFKINNSLKRIFFQKRNIICRVGFVRIQSGREKGDDEGQMKTCRLEVPPLCVWYGTNVKK